MILSHEITERGLQEFAHICL